MCRWESSFALCDHVQALRSGVRVPRLILGFGGIGFAGGNGHFKFCSHSFGVMRLASAYLSESREEEAAL